MKSNKKLVPPDQVLVYVIQKAIWSYKWLKELEIEWQRSFRNHTDGSDIRRQQGIVLDAFTVYISSLFDKTKGTHSFLKSYCTNRFINEFKNNSCVKLCIQHRNNRAGHQSKNYGSFVSLEVVLNSNLNIWLDDAFYLVCTKKMIEKE